MDLQEKVKSCLRSAKVKFSSVEVDDDRVIVRSPTRPNSPELAILVNAMKRCKCRKVNGFYGRWVFKKY